ncbi:MAG: hypothetical protein ACOX8U_03445 [Bradymonadia bacterium]|jgi:hypothetical protein
MSGELGMTEYVAAPRKERRVEGVDLEKIDERLFECVEFFHKHVEETDYRNLEWYMQRANLRYAAGDDIYEVLDDFFMAARCLHDRHAMHLDLKPPEMFMTRRIIPVELGIISGMPMLTLEFSATYGLPLMMVLSKTAPDEIMSEACLFSTFFRSGLVGDFYELAGLSAVIYAGVIAAIGRGFDDEAVLALNTYAKARDSLRGSPPAAALAKIKRYDALNAALACMCNGDFEVMSEILAPVAEDFLEDSRKRAGDTEFFAPTKSPTPKYFDSSILTILALVTLRGKSIPFPETGAFSHYRDFERGFTVMPERRIEIPGLDEEARRILQEAGIDPDAIEDQGQVDTGYRDEKAESEARALEILLERQRAAQEAVRKKLLERDEEDEEELRTEDFHQPRLKLREDDEEEDEEKAKKDFQSFFDDPEDEPPVYEDEPESEPEVKAKVKDFSDFFESHDEDDAESRERHEDEDSLQTDVGQSYSDFFENLNEAAIPKYDDGSADDIGAGAKEFSASFFDEAAQVPAFQMEADLEEREQSDLQSDESRDFTKLFSPTASREPALKMTLDDDEEVEEAPKPEPKKETPAYERDNSHIVEQDLSKTRDFSKIFEEDDKIPTDLRMSDDGSVPVAPIAITSVPQKDDREDEVLKSPEKTVDYAALFEEEDVIATDLRMSDDESAPVVPMTAKLKIEDLQDEGEALRSPEKTVDYAALFDELDDEARIEQEKEHADLLKELEAAQEAKRRLEAEAHAALKLELEEEELLETPETTEERLARLIAERDAAAKAAALEERERQLAELARIAEEGPKEIVTQSLQLCPDETTDPDEIVEKVQPEELIISPYTYTELDMIHENIAERVELEEDITVHDLLAQTEPQAKPELSVADDDDDVLLVALNYDEVADATKDEDKD